MQVSRRQIVVLGTGGTIAGLSPRAGDNLDYAAAQLPVAQLLEGVDWLTAELAKPELQFEQVAQVDSKDMDFAIWWALARRCQFYLAQAEVQGVVITHGTDTLEETAWFLHLVLGSAKPVVLTCAMRPANALQPDGPQNLRDALTLAMDPQARGVMVVAASKVHAAKAVQKMHPYRLDAFSSGENGPLAWVEEGRVRWSDRQPPACGKQFTLPDDPSGTGCAAHGPWVEVLMSMAGARPEGVRALVDAGVDGLVVVATGNGTLHQALLPALQEARERDVWVWVVTRCPEGAMLPGAAPQFPLVPGLSPVKACIQMLLALWAQDWDCLGHGGSAR